LEVLRAKAALEEEPTQHKVVVITTKPALAQMELQIEAMAVAVATAPAAVMVVQVLFIFPIRVILHQKVRYVTIQ
jgi:hypothetical protein